MAGPVSRQEEANPLFWLAWPVGNIGLSCLHNNPICRARKDFTLFIIINPFLI